MTTANHGFVAIVSLVACLNVYACVCLRRTDGLDRTQKVSQAILVWVAPVFGAVLVLAILRASDAGSMTFRGRGGRDADGFYVPDSNDSSGGGNGHGHSGHDAGGGDSGGGHGH